MFTQDVREDFRFSDNVPEPGGDEVSQDELDDLLQHAVHSATEDDW